MEEELYRVVFSGEITGEFDLDTTRRRFARAFRLDAVKTAQIFSGKRRVIRSRLPEQEATNFALKLLEIGCECYVESMPDPTDLSQQPGFVERRKVVRRLRFRRGPRPGAIVPDRRVLPSRRRVDLARLKQHGDFPGSTVTAPPSRK